MSPYREPVVEPPPLSAIVRELDLFFCWLVLVPAVSGLFGNAWDAATARSYEFADPFAGLIASLLPTAAVVALFGIRMRHAALIREIERRG